MKKPRIRIENHKGTYWYTLVNGSINGKLLTKRWFQNGQLSADDLFAVIKDNPEIRFI